MSNRCRNGEGPFFIEAITYRWFGHVDWREDIDVGVNRSSKDLKNWKRKDPIIRLKKSLKNNNFISENDFQNLTKNQSKLKLILLGIMPLNDSSPNWEKSLNYVLQTKNNE